MALSTERKTLTMKELKSAVNTALERNMLISTQS